MICNTRKGAACIKLRTALKYSTDVSKNLKNIKKISRALDGIIRRRNLTKSIGCEDKRNACIFGGVEIAEGISDINRSFQIVIPNDLADIVGFGIAGVSRTKMTFEVRAKTTGF